MTTQDELIARVRASLADQGEPFRDVFVGMGDQSEYDLSQTQISAVTVQAVITSPPSAPTLTENTHYALDKVNGTLITLGAYSPLAIGTTLIVNGSTAGMFTDAQLSDYVTDAFNQHTSGRTVQTRYKDTDGFIRYLDDGITLATLPDIEEPLVARLATIEALWDLATDASTDIDISSADGTHFARSQRYAQLRSQIDVLTDKYKSEAAQLNVGLWRIEVANLRRTSRQTGRLVPVFKEREYDDNDIPIRLLPPVDGRNEDESGIPSPAYGGWGY